jgi:hypothetical protein
MAERMKASEKGMVALVSYAALVALGSLAAAAFPPALVLLPLWLGGWLLSKQAKLEDPSLMTEREFKRAEAEAAREGRAEAEAEATRRYRAAKLFEARERGKGASGG